MDLLDAISGRRAIRKYKPDCPSEESLRLLIDAATWAPSAMNDQAWHFTVVTRPQLLDRIATRARVWLAENESWPAQDQEMRALLADPNFHVLHHAPALIVISAPASRKWTAEACAVAAQNLMLAATGLGLGSCWIGLVQGWLNSPEGREAIALPTDEKVIVPLVVGYASEQPRPPQRRKPVITWIRDEALVFDGGEPAATIATSNLLSSPVASTRRI